MESIRIGLVGDYRPSEPAHTSIPRVLHLASSNVKIDHVWLPTRALQADTERLLRGCDGIWCVPGCPYESTDGALNAIRFAREEQRPFVGSSAGFQHAVIEFIRNVAGIPDAAHGEVTLTAESPVICILDKPLRGVRGKVAIVNGTRFASLYGLPEAVEDYNCAFGFNPAYRAKLESAGMAVGAVGEDGGVHGVELAEHPFFVATLYLLGAPAMAGRIHPIVQGFVEACRHHKLKQKGSPHLT